jgi:hypothetical protein
MNYAAITNYYTNGPIQAGNLHRPSSDVLDRLRRNLHCAGGGQRIASVVTPTIRGISTYQPDCATRSMARVIVAAPVAPATIAILQGSAGRLFDPAGCGIFRPDDQCTQLERFATGSLDDSIARGGQYLCVDHSAVRLQGRFLTLQEDGQELRFRFAISDGARERARLKQIPAARGCSVKFKPTHTRSGDRAMAVYHRAELVEVSICLEGRPAWYGSRVAIES